MAVKWAYSLGCMNDSAGKFCPDKWTREKEEGRVEGKGHEEFPHEDKKEDQDVTARSSARTYSRTDQPDCAREFSQMRTSRRSAVEIGVGHRVASAGKPVRPPGC